MLRQRPEDLRTGARNPIDPVALVDATAIVEDIRVNGEAALRKYTSSFDGVDPDSQLVYETGDLETAYNRLPEDLRGLLHRTAARIESFAMAQMAAMAEVDVAVPGGRAGHTWQPVQSAGAYAPGGRYPLPSTVLMTVIPARVAGVPRVWVASPKPPDITLGAAHVAGADGLVAVGGAQAIAALAFGILSPNCELIVGPGNKWVTAAKKHLFGEVGIDGLAGPSEILVIADDEADAALVAADLLAQAEHDPDAHPMLLALSSEFIDRVEAELEQQLVDLPTAAIARAALESGTAVVADDLASAALLSDLLAPEHLALHTADAGALAGSVTNYGSLFIGSLTPEAMADYGVGPNHVLPTGGSARFQSGLSVYTFLRSPTWLRLDEPALTIDDVVALARLEGLEGHARAVLQRQRRPFDSA